MVDQLGLRERHKQRTRRELIQAALDLFESQGYDQTTVAQITAAAEVSTKTFFNYFETKADILFADPHTRLAAAERVIVERPAAQTVAETLERAVEQMFTVSQPGDRRAAQLRQQMIGTVPAVQTRAMHHVLVAHERLSQALSTAFPGELDRVTAAAYTGSVLGAVLGAMLASLRQGDPAAEMFAAVRSATDLALGVLRPAEATDERPPGTGGSKR